MQFLHDLVKLFYPEPDRLGRFTETPDPQVPQPFSGLLVHNHHMTVTLERHHQSLLDVHVLQRMHTPDYYSRKILLSRQSDQRVVQFGLVRLRLACLSPSVRETIISEGIPLGRVLIEHNVLRKINLLSVWCIEPGLELAKCLGLQPGEKCYGRTALISTDHAPAIELLEILPAVARQVVQQAALPSGVQSPEGDPASAASRLTNSPATGAPILGQ